MGGHDPDRVARRGPARRRKAESHRPAKGRGGSPEGGRPDDWTRVKSALKSLDEKAWVPWAQPSGRPGVWRLFAIRGLPDVGKPGPEDKVVIEVALPPGAGAGRSG